MAVSGEQDWYVSGVFNMSFINLNDTFGDYTNRAGLAVVVNAEETGLTLMDFSLDQHASRHESAGADKVLHNNLAPAPKDHHSVALGLEWDGNWDIAHKPASVHEKGGDLEISHNNLDLSKNDHHDVGIGLEWNVSDNVAHKNASVHEAGGQLEISHNNLSLNADDHHSRYTDAEARSAIAVVSNEFIAKQLIKVDAVSGIQELWNNNNDTLVFFKALTGGDISLIYRDDNAGINKDIIVCKQSTMVSSLGPSVELQPIIMTLVEMPALEHEVQVQSTAYQLQYAWTLEIDPRYYEYRLHARFRANPYGGFDRVYCKAEVGGNIVAELTTRNTSLYWISSSWTALSTSGVKLVGIYLKNTSGSEAVYLDGFVLQVKYR